MDLFFFLGAFFLFCLMLVKIVKKSKTLKLPPGPRKLPIIGNMHQLIGSQPHRILADLAKKYGPLMHLQLGEVSTVVVSSADAAKDILNTFDALFANRPTLLTSTILFYNNTDISFSPCGDYWRQLRKICTMELLTARRVQTFRSIREDEVLNMIKSISSQEGAVVNLTAKLRSLTLSITTLAAFGKRSKYHDEFLSLMDDVVMLMSGFNIMDMYPSFKILERITGIRHKLETLHKKIDEVLENILNEHRVKRAEWKPENGEAKQNLLDVLLNVQQSGEFGAPIADNNIKAVIFDIFSAGGETSPTTMGWTMAEMIKNPTVFRRAQDEVRQIYGEMGNVDESRLHELKYLHAVIKEALRLHPPGPFLLPRECSEKCEIQGYEIPVNTRILINAWAIGRDPQHWTEPEKFFPERFLDSEIDFKGTTFNYIPFGGGRRMCPGIAFALPVIELPLAQLLYHFDWKLPNNDLQQEQLDIAEDFGVVVRPKQDLLLIPIPYHHSSI
ncbi:tabersonine 16-hydroxylase 2 [Coffea arabica]|uniref:Tabersonine 16-hydroxylase 2 n=1 Tax=Coffea arabica TaxID=13443 RepID=A0A6P6XM34_COFAR|nr:tabersonine 16-hydroxylase 2-like [Coffea arabica]